MFLRPFSFIALHIMCTCNRCEIESTLERLRKLERELYSKEKELEERERRLRLWEERLKERSNRTPSPTSLLMERSNISPVSCIQMKCLQFCSD